MPRLLDHSPIFRDPSEVVVRGERVRIRADQIIGWVTLTRKSEKSPNPSAVPFPVILDTGFSHSLGLQERHLIAWAGLRPETLGLRGHARDRGQRVTLYHANIWIHTNSRGERDQLVDTAPHTISVPRGIAVYSSGGNFPRLPILGLSTITDNKLVLVVDGRKRQATLRTAFRWWPFP